MIPNADGLLIAALAQAIGERWSRLTHAERIGLTEDFREALASGYDGLDNLEASARAFEQMIGEDFGKYAQQAADRQRRRALERAKGRGGIDPSWSGR